jgi:adenine deaminase
VAPGWRADLAVIDSLESCRVSQVISAGRKVNDALFATRRDVPPVGFGSIKAAKVNASQFRVPGDGHKTPVIGVTPGKIITEHLTMTLPAIEGTVPASVEQDAIQVAVVERHGKNGNIGLGHVHGFGLKQGAIGSTVGHDSHNICVVGVSPDDMATAVNRLRDLGGGFVVVRDGAVLAELPLPIAGLMSDMRYEDVRAALLPLRQAAKSLGTTLAEPFLQVAFLPLPVIPHLKISDKGLVDVTRFELLSRLNN